MGIFGRTLRGGGRAGRGDNPHGTTTWHGFYPQANSWGDAKSGSSFADVSTNYANNHTRFKGDWAVGAIESGGAYYPTAMTKAHYGDYSAIDKDMKVGNLGFNTPRQARRAAVKGIKQSGGLPQTGGQSAPAGIVQDSQKYPSSPF